MFTQFEYTTGLIIQPDGRLVILGFTFDDVGTQTRITRYEPDGTLDASFGMEGTVVLDLGEDDEQMSAIALHADGKVLLQEALVCIPTTP